MPTRTAERLENRLQRQLRCPHKNVVATSPDEGRCLDCGAYFIVEMRSHD